MKRKALVLGRGASGKAAAAELEAQGYEVSFAEGIDLAVASPGIPVKSELQLGVEALRRRGTKLLAVTGSKGKSSVVKLVADALRLSGARAVPCGNYGTPVSSVGDCDWAVVEASSFQLETTALPGDAFVAAAILNLQEDHLDRHGSKDVYHALKKRLCTMAGKTFECKGPDDADALFAGSYFDNGVLKENARIAVGLLREAGVDDATVRGAFAAFAPLPHRMQRVGVFGGVECIDDSKATSLAALAAGVEMAGDSIRLVAGGLPKGDDPKSVLSPLTKRVKKVYLIGVAGETFAAAWSGAVDCEICGTMECAVACAMREARAGETVLLSPGAASFDQFQSFGERGEVFARLVKKEGKEKT
ncbi:MAG: hypothetical protein K6F50_06990 [Kiritimatiellae bacterium]|nr:hypothetical protein [Kiritimatiellia bacterium]